MALPLLDSLYNFARSLTGRREEAEDIVQETCVKALRGFATFRPGTNFRAWMFRILRNTFLTSRSGLKLHVPLPEEADGEPAVAAEEETPETLLLGRLDRERVWRAVESLPLPFREILLLREVEEMSYAERSETLGIPPGTVMSRLARARRSLRRALSGSEGEARDV